MASLDENSTIHQELPSSVQNYSIPAMKCAIFPADQIT